MNNHNEIDELIEVPAITEKGVPAFLKMIYILFPIGGIVAFFLYWNGSEGFLDRGSWKGLQEAALTTYPFQTTDKQSVLKTLQEQEIED